MHLLLNGYKRIQEEAGIPFNFDHNWLGLTGAMARAVIGKTKPNLVCFFFFNRIE